MRWDGHNQSRPSPRRLAEPASTRPDPHSQTTNPIRPITSIDCSTGPSWRFRVCKPTESPLHQASALEVAARLAAVATKVLSPIVWLLWADAPVRTYVHRTVAHLGIRADVYLSADDWVRPVAVRVDGGALIMGRRENLSLRLRDQLIQGGFVAVSIDYRLATDTKLPTILEDLGYIRAWRRAVSTRDSHSPANQARLDEVLELDALPRKGWLRAAERVREGASATGQGPCRGEAGQRCARWAQAPLENLGPR